MKSLKVNLLIIISVVAQLVFLNSFAYSVLIVETEVESGILTKVTKEYIVLDYKDKYYKTENIKKIGVPVGSRVTVEYYSGGDEKNFLLQIKKGRNSIKLKPRPKEEEKSYIIKG